MRYRWWCVTGPRAGPRHVRVIMIHDRVQTTSALLDRLEAIHGVQEPCFPTDPYEFLIWWHCGYPQSDDRCTRGWTALKAQVGVTAKVRAVGPGSIERSQGKAKRVIDRR